MEKILAGDEPDKAHRAALDDRHAADALGGHAVGELSHGLVGISDDQSFVGQPIGEGVFIRWRFLSPSQNVGPARHSNHPSVLVLDRIGFVAGFVGGEERDRVLEAHMSRKRVDRAHHDIADQQKLERINAVLANDMLASRAIFSVRIDRLSMSTVTPYAAPVAIRSGVRRVKSPVSSTAKARAVRGERIVPPIIAAMPISAQAPESPGQKLPLKPSDGAAQHEQRRQHAAGGPRGERDDPDDRL